MGLYQKGRRENLSNVKRLRLQKKRTQAELANVLGITLSAYGKKENAHLRFSLNEAKKLSDFYGVSIEDIFFGDDISKMEILNGNNSRKEAKNAQ